jgi:hypothetical protein
MVFVSIVDVTSNTATAVTDATVEINGTDIPYNASQGGYIAEPLSSEITSGTVTLSITSPEGDASASGTMPVSGANPAYVTITGAAISGSYLILFQE